MVLVLPQSSTDTTSYDAVHRIHTADGSPAPSPPGTLGSSSPTMSVSSGAASLLKRQLKEIRKSKDLQGISCGLFNDDNLFEWEVMLMISDDCKYYGGTSSSSYH